ncbi:DUF4157 domain-containing protein [Rhizobiaceae bacterium n13]|uniref:eCIS core domain-containing protein n=1 Tax=Ferirhizobium litorale TaxID=2927786 RepID=UPI0024B30418|nr:DUF4157 domain-containing protein [Fererhizobium litorale]MDI7862553.1 DUF4157 domain-containing protein [Fererhizobium litorale]
MRTNYPIAAVVAVLATATPTVPWAFDIQLPGGGRICDTCGGGLLGGSRLPDPTKIPPLTPLQTCLQNLASCPDAVIQQHRSDLELVEACVKDIAKCPEAIIKSIPARSFRPIIDAYISDLRNQADGRWNSIPGWINTEFQRQYPEINFAEVKYATSIDTRHGQAITIGYEIYFPRQINLQNQSDLEWFLHELEHVVQYRNKGGIDAFVSEYVLHVSGAAISNGTFNVHDDLSVERAAAAKAESLINDYGWQFSLRNNCKYPVDVSIFYLNNNTSEWEHKYWYNINTNDKIRPNSDDLPLHTKNRIWAYYARIPGENYAWKGDVEVNTSSGEKLMHKQIEETPDELNRNGMITLSLGCDNKD